MWNVLISILYKKPLLLVGKILQKITGISSIIADQRFTAFVKSRRSEKQTKWIPVEKSARTLTNYYSFDQRISWHVKTWAKRVCGRNMQLGNDNLSRNSSVFLFGSVTLIQNIKVNSEENVPSKQWIQHSTVQIIFHRITCTKNLLTFEWDHILSG